MARTRAYRRNQKARARNRARRIVDQVWRFGQNRFSGSTNHEEWRQRLICQLSVDRKPCSCEGCGNQRRWYGPTLQELRVDTARASVYDSWESEVSNGEDPETDSRAHSGAGEGVSS